MDFRVEKKKREATLTLSNGTVARGFVFLSGCSATHSGAETVKELLNSGTGFVPFELLERDGTRTLLYNRQHIVLVTLPDDAEVRDTPGYDVAVTRAVSLLLSNGTELMGFVRVTQPEGRDRLSDHARFSEPFWHIETPTAALIVNSTHVLQLMDVNP